MTQKLILAAFLFLIAFAAYTNSLSGDFLIDDHSAILNNPRIHNLQDYFTNHFKLKPGALWELSHAITWKFSSDNPFFYHLFNVLAHGFCTACLFWLCNILFKDTALSFLSGFIFALHPIHTEAISWISAGHYAFSSLFFILALIFYIKSGVSICNLALCALSCAVCLLAGNAAATLPLAFICYEVFFENKAKQNIRLIKFRRFIFSCAAVISLLVIATHFVSRDIYVHSIFRFRGVTYLVVVFKALAYYLKIIYLPLSRGLYHPFAYSSLNMQAFSPAFFLSLSIIALAAILFFRLKTKNPAVSFGIGFFFIAYLPYSNIIPVCNIISERYMYLASAGICIIFAAAFIKIWRLINKTGAHRMVLRWAAVTAITLFLGSYAFLTLKRNYEYSNLITYWETNIKNFPQGCIAYNNLAGTYYAMGDKAQAVTYCWLNLMVNPNQPHVWRNLGNVYRQIHDEKKADFCYNEAMKQEGQIRQ